MPDAASLDALAALRGARKRVRTRHIDWVDAMYRAYILSIVGIVAVLVASGYVGDGELDPTAVADVRTYGAAALGAVVTIALVIGARSGARGGPLALEATDVRHVLLAPIDRSAALRAAALRQVRHLALGGLVVGATAGQLAARRLPGNPATWTACGAGALALGTAAGAGLGYLASGRRWSRRATDLLALALVGWSAADLATGHATAPASLLGRLVLWPFEVDLLALAGIALALVVLVAGIASIGGLSIEAAERRSSLIGRLAFAATLQDLRTVLVLRRQLAQEHARRRPWSGRVPFADRYPVWARGWRGVLRWPLVRVARLVVLGLAAGAALDGVASGTTPLVVAAGLALHIAALDAVEPLAQEVDHPSRTDLAPIARGAVHVRHLPVSFVVMGVAGAIGLAGALALRPQISTLEVGALVLVTGAVGAVAGAAIGTISGPPDPLSAWALGAPEIAGLHTVLRLLWPPALAVLGCAPVIAATKATTNVAGTTALTAALVLLLELGVVAWVHARDDVLANIRATFDSFGKAR